ncbi:MAG TPA: CBS domain-containing protein [Longimicrobium sp.]
MKARDLMTHDPYVVVAEEPVCRAAEIMREEDVGVVPVVDNFKGMHLRGVITDRDIAIRCVAVMRPPDMPVEHCMTTEHLVTVHPGDSVEAVMKAMESQQVRRVMVVDGKRLVGVISQADLLRREGRLDPVAVEAVLEHISEPAHAHT